MSFEDYEDYSVARASAVAVASTIPVVGALVQVIDAGLAEAARRVQRARLETFLDELETGAKDLTREIAVTEPWLHACYVTIEAVLRTDRNEKIRWFARLMLAGAGDTPQLDLESEHETYLKILDELTHLEIGMLTILLEFETKRGGGRMFWWGEYIKELCTRFSIPEGEVYPLLARLVRTGTYVLDSATGFTTGSYAGTGVQGSLTRVYYRLANMIQVQPEELVRSRAPGATDGSPEVTMEGSNREVR